MRFEFSATTPRPWLGRYARIPGETTVLHVRLTSGQWWPFVDWTVEDETAQCPMFDSDGAVALAAAVHEGKKFLGGTQGGAFLINEYGQTLVPSPLGDGKVALVGECSGALRFRDMFHAGATFDLADDRTLEPGAPWGRPYVGIPYNLSAASQIYFWKEDYSGGMKITPPQQDHTLVEAIRILRPFGAVRFVVNYGGIVLTKIPAGNWRESRWEPRFVARLNQARWYPKED